MLETKVFVLGPPNLLSNTVSKMLAVRWLVAPDEKLEFSLTKLSGSREKTYRC